MLPQIRPENATSCYVPRNNQWQSANPNCYKKDFFQNSNHFTIVTIHKEKKELLHGNSNWEKEIMLQENHRENSIIETKWKKLKMYKQWNNVSYMY